MDFPDLDDHLIYDVQAFPYNQNGEMKLEFGI